NDWKVKKGEKGSLIQFVKLSDFVTKRDENGKPVLNEQGKATKIQVNLAKPIITGAWVFNASQIDGITPLKALEHEKISWKPLERAENLVINSNAKIHNQISEKAFYSTLKDAITMPLKEQFSDASRYYATLLHELGHWTGHKDRLDRSLMNKFGSEDYAREELRAKIASLLVGQELRIGHDPNHHASYVDSWIKVLKQNPFEIHQAASDAEKIFDYLIGFEQKRLIAKEVANQASSKVQNTDRLSVQDEIAYNSTVYKIQGHLKGGRFRVEDLGTSKQFTLSPNDGLYNSLLKAKQEPLSAIARNNQQTDRKEIELKSYSARTR
ncbi:MAG: conjugal transfer protein TraC, partial [Daejeonella sp.]|nr:conjugal transfer protein TraC [Daejeonella sp.]